MQFVTSHNLYIYIYIYIYICVCVCVCAVYSVFTFKFLNARWWSVMTEIRSMFWQDYYYLFWLIVYAYLFSITPYNWFLFEKPEGPLKVKKLLTISRGENIQLMLITWVFITARSSLQCSLLFWCSVYNKAKAKLMQTLTTGNITVISCMQKTRLYFSIMYF